MPKRGKREEQPARDLYVKPPERLEAFPNAERVSSKTRFAGGKLRRRWKDFESGMLYEWDYQHGRVEVYDKRGSHLYKADPSSGAETGPRKPQREIEP